jgi:phage-related baseplate assembly protein
MINSSATTLDLSALPPPDSVEQISFEAILASMLADLRARDPAYNTISEADPAYKILQVCAYRETLLRQRENNKTRALMLAFATGADLDHIGVTYFNGTTRLVLQAANTQASPPTPQVLEGDDDYRRRLLLQPEGESVAGPEGAYVFHALSAHADVIDASAYSPWPAGVVVTVLSRFDPLDPLTDPASETATLTAVATHLAAAVVLTSAATPIPAATDMPGPAGYTSGGLRPVADRVIVRPATRAAYTIDADVVVPTGPDVGMIGQLIAANLRAYKDAPRRLGRDIARSAIYAAIHVPGVERVTLNQPAADVVLDSLKAAQCTSIAVRINGVALSV